jgi:hypothetical protein
VSITQNLGRTISEGEQPRAHFVPEHNLYPSENSEYREYTPVTTPVTAYVRDMAGLHSMFFAHEKRKEHLVSSVRASPNGLISPQRAGHIRLVVLNPHTPKPAPRRPSARWSSLPRLKPDCPRLRRRAPHDFTIREILTPTFSWAGGACGGSLRDASPSAALRSIVPPADAVADCALVGLPSTR